MRFVARQIVVAAAAAMSIAIAIAGDPGQAAQTRLDAEAPDIPLARALSALARDTGAELLFNEDLVRNLTVPPLRRQVSVEAGLTALLAGTGLGYRRTRDGAYVLARPGAPAPFEPGEEAVAEILVIGRRTQNADIRRTENDIQPYQVITRREIDAAHRDNIDQFLRSRLPANADILSPSQDIVQAPGQTQSRIDLRGIGSRRTLVLIDGRRLPSLPAQTVWDFEQADLNGIPFGAIDRNETLT